MSSQAGLLGLLILVILVLILLIFGSTHLGNTHLRLLSLNLYRVYMHLYELISSFPSCQLAAGKENFMNFGEQHGIIRFLFSSHPILIYEDSKNYTRSLFNFLSNGLINYEIMKYEK